jgi:hypothetical protein
MYNGINPNGNDAHGHQSKYMKGGDWWPPISPKEAHWRRVLLSFGTYEASHMRSNSSNPFDEVADPVP